jgi:hypothetical protein
MKSRKKFIRRVDIINSVILNEMKNLIRSFAYAQDDK